LFRDSLVVGLKIEMFGEFRVRRDGHLVESSEWDRQKTRSLLKLLLTRPGRAFSKDEICDALWPGASPGAADHRLRTTVSLLRRVLEPDLGRGRESRYILQTPPGYAFNEGSDCEVDAWEFDEHRNRAEEDRLAGRLDAAVEGYRAALALVRGEFLAEDPYEEWAVESRQECRERQLSVLSGLAECLALKGLYTEAVEACERALTLDRYSEELHRRLMLCLYCAGEQARALQSFRRYAGVLEEELGTAPSSELTRLKEQIEARDVPGVDELRRYPKPRRPLKLPYSLSRTRFVGRDAEYALLVERLREATAGRGSAIAVEGEAGVGKTRLVEEFLGYARSRGVQVLSGRCYERELGPPLEPVLEALGHTADISEMVSEVPYSGGGEPGYRWEDRPYERANVYRVLTEEVTRRSRDDSCEALVLFVDDVQWTDSATLDFLSYLARRVSGGRMLLLFTYRREQAPELSGWLGLLEEQRALETLSLDRLSPEDTGGILARMVSRGFDELPRLTDFLHRESEGNPFYAVEYLRWLIESGVVRIDSRRRIYGLDSGALQGGSLPSGVRTLLQARLRSLTAEARELLELAAVAGRTFGPEFLQRTSARERDEVLETIELAVSSGLIVVASETGAYDFSHDKLRQELYEGIGGDRRRELHLRVAEALEDSGGEPAELAHHYLRAREWQMALESLTLAAKRTEEGYAWGTALEIYARAFEVLREIPDSEEREFELLASRDRLLEHLDRREERAETVQQMFELATRLEDQSRIAEAHIRRIGVLAALSDPTGAAEAGREAVAAFQDLGDLAGEARAHRESGYVYWMIGDYAEALEANFRALRLHCKIGSLRGEAGDAGNIAQVYRSIQDYDKALYWAREALRIDHELGDRLGEGFRLNLVGTMYQEQGDLEAALSMHLRSLEGTVVSETKNLMATQHMNCGKLYLSLKSPEEALEHFREAARLSRETGYTRDEGYSLLSVGAALEQLGDFPGAAEAYRRSAELLETAYAESGAPKELSGRAEALTLLAAVLHYSQEAPAEALEAYETAAGIYRELGDVYRLRRLLMGSAGLRWRTGSLEGSARDYEEALELAREQQEAATEAAALASLSVVYRGLGRLKESVRCGKEALALLRELEDPQAEAYTLTSLAQSHCELGHHPSALSCLKRSLRLRREVGDGEGEAKTLRDLAGVHEALGEVEQAGEASERAERKENELGGACSLFSLERRS